MKKKTPFSGHGGQLLFLLHDDKLALQMCQVYEKIIKNTLLSDLPNSTEWCQKKIVDHWKQMLRINRNIGNFASTL